MMLVLPMHSGSVRDNVTTAQGHRGELCRRAHPSWGKKIVDNFPNIYKDMYKTVLSSYFDKFAFIVKSNALF